MRFFPGALATLCWSVLLSGLQAHPEGIHAIGVDIPNSGPHIKQSCIAWLASKWSGSRSREATKVYRIEAVLGTGASATVYQVMERKSKEQYALKAMRRTATDPIAYQDEIRNHQEASHLPGVVTLIEAFETDAELYLVTELGSRGDLYDLIIKKSPVAANWCVKKHFLLLVDTVISLSGLGIYHMDLAPENIIVAHDGTLKIIDFGNSQNIATTQKIVGHQAYIAPDSTFKSDPCAVWSLTKILLLMTSARPLWRRSHISDPIYCAYLKYPHFDGFTDLSPEFQQLLQQGLACNPSKRLTLQQLRDEVSTITNFVIGFYLPPIGEDQLWPKPPAPAHPLHRRSLSSRAEGPLQVDKVADLVSLTPRRRGQDLPSSFATYTMRSIPPPSQLLHIQPSSKQALSYVRSAKAIQRTVLHKQRPRNIRRQSPRYVGIKRSSFG